MSCFRPATPGFIVSLIATILLSFVVFCVPYVKSVYFLKAGYNGVSGNITFGTLGYCVELSGNTTCSTSVGYQLDINALVANNLNVQIPSVVGKWVTYILLIHVVALAGAAASALFGLLAHVREMSMTCCSMCFSGFGAVITIIAFIFDIVFFSIVKARLKQANAFAQIGSAVWLTLVAWGLLFFSGCFFACGRCCMRTRPSYGGGGGGKWLGNREAGGPDKSYAEEMRLDAVKAEADRKARQKQKEVGLPAFYETQPLTGDQIHLEGDKPEPTSPPSGNLNGGYAPGRIGTRAVDDYHRNDTSPTSAVYSPQREVRRQQSEHSAYSVPTSTASPPINSTRPSGYRQYSNAPMSTSPPPSNNQLLVPSGHHQRYNTDPDPYGREYGHMAGGTSYHTAVSHDQAPSTYGQPIDDPYAYQPHQTQPHLAQSTYQSNPYMSAFPSTPMPQPTTDYFPPITTSPPPIQQPQPSHGDRSYTLGGDSYGGGGYGGNELPPLPEHQPSLPPGAGAPSYLAFDQQHEHQLPPIDTNVDAGFTGQHFQTSPGPLGVPNDSPPGYESDAHWSRR